MCQLAVEICGSLEFDKLRRYLRVMFLSPSAHINNVIIVSPMAYCGKFLTLYVNKTLYMFV